MSKAITAGTAAVTLARFPAPRWPTTWSTPASPVTVKGYSGSKTTSVSYTGQIARHVLHDSLKKLAGSGNGKPNPELKAKMMAYFGGKDAGREIIAPATKGPFAISQSAVDDISKGKNLSGKTFEAAVTGMPNGMIGPELVEFWDRQGVVRRQGIRQGQRLRLSATDLQVRHGRGVLQPGRRRLSGRIPQRVTKSPTTSPTRMERPTPGKSTPGTRPSVISGRRPHTLKLTPKQVYGIAKRKSEAFADADYNKDGKVDLRTEMTFGPAYYAAGFDASVYDRSNGTNYLHTITKAFLDGRKLLTDAKGEKLTDEQRDRLKRHASVITQNWEKVLAEATFKYAGSVYKDMVKLQTITESNGDPSKQFRKYVKHWGELKGFALALQSGKNNLGETATRLNRLIGAGPLLLNASQVVDIDSQGNYVRDQGPDWGEYMLHMAKVQKLMIDQFGVQARNNDVTQEMQGPGQKSRRQVVRRKRLGRFRAEGVG